MPSTEIAAIDVKALVPTQVFAPGGIDAILSTLEAKVRAEAEKLDVSTPKGRAAIASLAYQVARSKSGLEEMGKILVADIKAQASAIDADRRTARNRLDALRDEVRKPLDDFEAAEKERANRHEAGISDISNLARIHSMGEPETESIANRLEKAKAVDTSGFEEFTKRADVAKAEAIAALTDMLDRSRARDAERAELERLRQEAAERAQKEEAARIEREKQEAADRAAAQAKAEAEAKAKREAEAVEREAAAALGRIEHARRVAEQEKAEAEARATQAEADRIAAEKRAKEAEEQAEADKQAAVLRERQRAENERKAAEAAAAAREADKEHRAKVNREAVAGLMSAGLSEADAKTAVTAIARAEVQHIKITY